MNRVTRIIVCHSAVFIALSWFIACSCYSQDAEPTDRTWTDKSGKHKIVAAFEKLEDGKVFLKRKNNGKTISLQLAKLCKDDQDVVKRITEGKPDENSDAKSSVADPDDILSKLKMKAKAEWSEFSMTDENGNETFDLDLRLSLTGVPAKNAAKFGNLRIEKLIDQEDNEVERKEGFMMDDFFEKMIPVQREGMFSDHPKTGIGIKLGLDTSSGQPEKIALFSGSIDLLTDAKILKVTVNDVSDLLAEGKAEIENAELERLGITANLSTENGLQVVLEGSLDNVLKVAATNTKAKSHPQQTGSSWSGGSDMKSYGFNFEDEKLPSDLCLVVEIAEGGTVVTVPFEFKNLKVPSPKKRR